ncbi:MAG: hypothetical protein DRQ24_04295 [Candidatus Latescibacterota bacterium]|nr:MAG: hypothetical protein DRQ24_04295 [Candidatus Latescibacterota bacterium]
MRTKIVPCAGGPYLLQWRAIILAEVTEIQDSLKDKEVADARKTTKKRGPRQRTGQRHRILNKESLGCFFALLA